MAKFNETNKNVNKTTNKSGFVAYKMNDKDKLITQVLTSFFNESKFYGDNSNELVETATSVCKTDPRFVANLAIYARKEFHLRSVAHVLTCIVANAVDSKKYTRQVMNYVVERPDDLTEILACYINTYGKPIPNSLKKGLADNLARFNEFQISKYNGGSKAVKFKDILQLTHAKPKNEAQSELFKKILEDNLATATRWETEVSAKGNNEETWEALLEKNQLGYMAALRNLRNIINANPKNINKVYEKLENREEVLKSKQLPFRFYSAYKEISKMPNSTNKPLDVLENALEISVENIKRIPGKTAICIDSSGSMGSPISKESSIQCWEIAALLGAMANKICDEAVIYIFSNSASKFPISKNASILDTVKYMPFISGGTSIASPIEQMISDNMQVDRIIILSDNEANDQFTNTRSSWFGEAYCAEKSAQKYRDKFGQNVWVHAIDLQGYGTQQFLGSRTNLIAGWSEKVLDFIMLAEEGTTTLAKTIANYMIKED